MEQPSTPLRPSGGSSRDGRAALVTPKALEPAGLVPRTPRSVLHENDKNRLVKQFLLQLPEPAGELSSESRAGLAEIGNSVPGAIHVSLPLAPALAAGAGQVGRPHPDRAFEPLGNSLATTYTEFQNQCTQLSNDTREFLRVVREALAELEAELPVQAGRFEANVVEIETIKQRLKVLEEYDRRIVAVRGTVATNFKGRLETMNNDLDQLEQVRQSYQARLRVKAKQVKVAVVVAVAVAVAVAGVAYAVTAS